MCRCDDDNCHPMELLLPPLQCSPAVTKSCIHPKFKWSKCLKKPTPVLRCTLQACEQHLLLLKASLGFLKASATSGSCPLICQKQTKQKHNVHVLKCSFSKSCTFQLGCTVFASDQYLLPNHILCPASWQCHPHQADAEATQSSTCRSCNQGASACHNPTKGFPLEQLIFNHYKSTEV